MAQGTCSRCGNDRKIVTRRTGAPLCGSCLRAVKPPTICETCGQPTRAPRRSDTGAALCPRCHAAHTPPEQCGVCRQVKRVHHRPDGSPICSGCYGRSRPPEACARCGTVARVVARRPEGPLCEACRIYEKTGRRCRCAAPFLVDRACLLCAAERNGRAELADAIRTRLVAGGLAARKRLRYSVAGRLLQAMLRGTIPVEVSAVAGLNPDRPAAAVHAELVELGLLDPRDEPLAEVQHALDEAVSSAHADDAGTLAQFGRWVVLHDVAARIARGTARLGTPKTARDKIRRIAQLLADLRHDNVPLAELEQSWTDEWVASHRSARPDLRVFLAWARQRGLAPRHVDVDPAQSAEVRAEIDEDHRQGLLGRFLEDDTIEPRDRVAGFLVVGLGQPLTRIVALRTDHVLEDPVRLQLGTVPLRMPPPIDDLVRVLTATAVDNKQPWLFIGQRGHLSAARLSERLRDLGVANVIATRNAAWAALAAETPPVILAEKLGASVSTADKWSNAVAGARNLYAALAVGSVEPREALSPSER
jgi:hypothetical protein